MPRIQGTYGVDVGALAGVALTDASVAGGAKLNYTAMFDSGSQISCISATVARDLNLQRWGIVLMSTASRQELTSTYRVGLEMRFPDGSDFLGEFLVAEFAAPPHSGFEILLGRDVIRRGDLYFSHDGRFSFALARVP